MIFTCDKMASKFKQQNIFESGFDSFEFDDGFLMKLDSELKKNKINEKQSGLPNNYKGGDDQGNNKKKVSDVKADYYDLPLFIEDLDDSDFFDATKSHRKNNLSKAINNSKDVKENRVPTNSFITNLSPILGTKSSQKLNLSSSTPLRPIDDSNLKEKPSTLQSQQKNSEFDYLEADLFDDWEVNQTDTKDPPKDTVTFSQALKLIEEAESARRSDQEGCNLSLDLLTGEVVGSIFEESFDLPKSTEKKELLNNSVEVICESKVVSKPAAAHKLNFGLEKANGFDSSKKLDIGCGFNSDDDFDFLTQELLKKPKILSKYKRGESKSPDVKSEKKTPLKCCDLNDSDDVIILKKNKGRCLRLIESDGTDDSPSPKFRRKNLPKRTNFQQFGRAFIDSEAEVSDEVEVSSDEAEEEGEYDQSFVDEESYLTQNDSANMTAKYLESVKTVKRHSGFKIPAAKPYIPDNIFSQIPEEGNTDYEIDSFCVPNDVEEEIKTDLSDLEVAEKILEMDRRKRRKKRTRQFR